MENCDLKSFIIFSGAAAGCMGAGSLAYAYINNSKAADFWQTPVRVRFFTAFVTSVTFAQYTFGIAKELSPVTGMTATWQKVTAFAAYIGIMCAVTSEGNALKGDAKGNPAVPLIGAAGGIAGFFFTRYLADKYL